MKQVTLLLLAVGCLLMPGKGRAQEFLISGRTLDIHGEPLPFTTIRVGETALGASSDAEGNYKLRLPAGRHVLTATLVGYLPATRTVSYPTSNLPRPAWHPTSFACRWALKMLMT